MRQPRRWAAFPIALLMAASLVFAPQEGRAGPAGSRIMLPGDPPMLTDPDVPTNPGPRIGFFILPRLESLLGPASPQSIAIATSMELVTTRPVTQTRLSRGRPRHAR